MEEIHEYFSCDSCANKDFKCIYNFSLRFHGVNFSDDLIYDQLIDEVYQCTKCHRTFTKKQIEERLGEIKKRRRKSR